MERLEMTRQSLSGDGHVMSAYDLSRTDEITAWMRDLAQQHGKLDGLVHCAGVLMTKPLRAQVAMDWEDTMRINVTAGAALAKGFRQRQVCRGGGSIVYMTSISWLKGQPGQTLYGATKGALVSMTRSMALELARESIRVNCVAPALVDAGMNEQWLKMVTPDQYEHIKALHPLGIGRVEDVGYAVAFLLGETARWITGTTLVVDGGYSA